MRIVLIGAGNVATNLAKALCAKHEIEQIYSRTLANAKTLADAVGCRNACSDFADIVADADFYIISVKDDAIASVVEAVPGNGAMWVHTSGSKPIDVFAGSRSHYGVFYPMQSFSKQITVDFSEVPFFIEGSSGADADSIMELARSLSHRVYAADSNTRRHLHVAAVFACNFANHVWTIADEVLAEAGLPFDVMLPLIRTTVDKLDKLSPVDSQTGPAVRCDYNVISKHLSMLSGDKHEVYDTMTKSIIRFHNKKSNINNKNEKS